MIEVVYDPQDLNDLIVLLSEFEKRLKSTRIRDFTGRLTKDNVLHILRDERIACQGRLGMVKNNDWTPYVPPILAAQPASAG